jgi:hypothetical protein
MHRKAACALRDHPALGRWLKQHPGIGRLSLDRAKVAAEARLDGKYLLATSDPDLSAEAVTLGYKNLMEAERAFRTMKSTLYLRPVYHHLDQRIRAHVLLCWLDLLLIRVIRPQRPPQLRTEQRAVPAPTAGDRPNRRLTSKRRIADRATAYPLRLRRLRRARRRPRHRRSRRTWPLRRTGRDRHRRQTSPRLRYRRPRRCRCRCDPAAPPCADGCLPRLAESSSSAC